MSDVKTVDWGTYAPVVVGCAGPQLTAEERVLFGVRKPLGLILFARNIVDPAQVKALVADFRAIVGNVYAPVLIDQEGGRVARLKPPHWPAFPRGAVFGQMYTRDPAVAEEAAYLNYRWIGAELAALGIDVDCAPVADLPVEGAHDVIGDRAYGRDADTVSLIAEAVMRGLADAGVMPVVKHIPGHGRSHTDSHLDLPVVDTPAELLEASDLLPFVALRHAPWAMTAHIVYTAYDAVLPATLSSNVIRRVIRERIGFDGVLISDDLTMKALKGSPAVTGVASLHAGCDLVLHCSGDLPEMQALLAALPAMTGEAARRVAQARAALPAPRPFSAAERLRYQSLMEQVPV
ncbi:MAG: beta-N-acetylhexosaminidase [Ferrovibrio sp.]|uniref:beta-N-acetylhexosaminidase n=1 Tax=Ferrovibrio sp. TaxID=1917215 RepID=UPI002639D669|nr:beta-N-acetylhexosaminidase [Ferrovibrio sp.]MCW0236421.1 beta-N-acetylhexosaminidase [Ferrovibrio sp.]